MQSKRFGVAWVVHQTLPQYARAMLGNAENNSDERFDRARQAFAVSEAALAHIMPCRFCRSSYAGFRLICDAQHCFVKTYEGNRSNEDSVADGAEAYFFNLHNLVNAKLDKALLSPAARHTPAFTRAKDAHNFRCALVEWFAMLAMNYEKIEPRTTAARRALRQFVACVAQDGGQWQGGLLWRAAFEQQSDLAPLVDRWIERTLRENGGAEEIGCRDARARAWLVLYIDALCTLLESATAPTRARQCGSALRKRVGLLANTDEFDAFASSGALLQAVFDVKKHCVMANEQCESLNGFLRRIESYRAQKCAKGTCT